MSINQQWRPSTFDSFVGQTTIMNQLRLEVQSAKNRRPVRHAVFYGPGGLGKNTVADILAHEMGVDKPNVIFGSALTHESLSDALLALRSPGYDMRGCIIDKSKVQFPLLVIDECQKMPRDLLELLHPVLEPTDPHGRLTMTCKVRDPKHGHKYRTSPLWIVQCTLIFITNYLGELYKVSPATLSRIPLQLKFEWYPDEEMIRVIEHHARQMNLNIDAEGVEMLCKRCNGMPRRAASLLSRAQDYQVAANQKTINSELLKGMFTSLGIDENGLDPVMLRYLQTLSKATNGKLGLQAIASVLNEDQSTLVQIVEPTLMRNGLIMRVTGGREITPAGMTIVLGRQEELSPLNARSLD